MGFLSFLDRERTVAKPGFNRWLVPPAALSIHLCIGQIYAYSVLNDRMTRIIGITEPAPDDWKLSTLGWTFSIALFCLGASAALFGKWVERSGPRKTMFYSALCFSSGFVVTAIGIWTHQLILVYLGNGVLGGIGLGLGYISPVSTLIKWFPDRPGMATGMAIMGFGGGAMIAAPMSVKLLKFFESTTSTGLAETMLVLGGVYFLFMLFGMLTVRVPEKDWQPAGFDPSQQQQGRMITSHQVEADVAIRTPQFYMVFFVLLLNVTAGIGVLGQASVMITEMFSGPDSAAPITEEAAAAFVGLLSLFNMAGRFIWSSLSDRIGRKNTYSVFFLLGALLYVLVPSFGGWGSVALFVAAFAVIISMYGGGFATVPAYLRDLFGTLQVGAIHGRLLLAWSLAALIGPALVNYIREFQLEVMELPPAQVYSITMYIMAGLLCIGFIINRAIKPVAARYHYQENDE